MTAALRNLGFKRVFDTSFSADLTIMEEASELVNRIQNNGKLPMMTSCSPAWIKFVEQFYPDYLDNVSTCKSPQQMMGAIIKNYYAQKNGIDPKDVYVVSVMPCVAKKFEAQRPEMSVDGMADVDAVINTRELAQMIRSRGIDMEHIDPEHADNPFGERSTAGKLFGASGGVMEAAIRTANFMLTGKELDNMDVKPVRGLKGVKEASVTIEGMTLNVAVVSGLGNARKLMDEIRAGRKEIHFLEVMSCPGGCINGGGQPIGQDTEAVVSRMKALYKLDRESSLRVSHKNPSIQRLYDEFLGEPLSETSHKILHTHYHKREVTV
jgi:iron-only hydrogenase group A